MAISIILQGAIQTSVSIINSPGGAALLGGLAGIVGVVVGYFLNMHVERYKNNLLNKREHYDAIRQSCLDPLYKKLRALYGDNFNFGQHIRYNNMPDAVKDRIVYYYDYLLSGEKEFPTEDWGYFYDFYFRRKTEGLDTYLYDDLDKHFPYLKDLLGECENFISEKGMKARRDIFQLSKFVYQNRNYNNFIKKVIRKNFSVEKYKVRKNYFVFAVILLLTSNEVLAKDKVPVISDLGFEDECMQIIEPYLGSLRPYVYKKERVSSNNRDVEEIWEINLGAEKLFDRTLGEIGVLKHKAMLAGSCEYIE